MLVQLVRYTFAPENADKATEMIRELCIASRTEPGVRAFDAARSADAPNVLVLWEEYADEAALDAHKATEHFQRLVLNGVRPLAQQRNAETFTSIA